MWIDQRGSEVVSHPECLRLLATAAKEGSIGHLAVSTDGAPSLQPVNFAYDDELIVLRLGPGRLAQAASGSLVSFEVDRLDRETGVAWSVLVQGLARPWVASEHPGEGLHTPVPLVPEPGDLLLTVRPDVVTGRRFPLQHPDGGRPAGTPGAPS